MTTDYVADPDMWEAFETLRHAHIYNTRGYRTFSGGLPVILICTDDDQLGDVDLVAASNFATIREALADDETVKVATGPYSDALYALADEEGNPVSDEVAAIVRALEDYPLFDESDYVEREAAFVEENLGQALTEGLESDEALSEAARDWLNETDEASLVARYGAWQEATGEDYPTVNGWIEVPGLASFAQYLSERHR